VTVDQLQNLLERLGALLRAEQRVSGLPSAQFEALRYLAICNRYSNGPAAVADYLQISPGSASQSLQALEKKGLIQRQASSEDGRRLHQRLTRKGRRTLDRTAPSELLANTLEAMPKNVATRLCRDLESLLRSAQRERGGASFGLCRTCAHFRREDSGRFRCGLTGEVLSTEDSEFICREHRVVESS
jgi:DNA-binding MarR family transcriptional regulator